MNNLFKDCIKITLLKKTLDCFDTSNYLNEIIENISSASSINNSNLKEILNSISTSVFVSIAFDEMITKNINFLEFLDSYDFDKMDGYKRYNLMELGIYESTDNLYVLFPNELYITFTFKMTEKLNSLLENTNFNKVMEKILENEILKNNINLPFINKMKNDLHKDIVDHICSIDPDFFSRNHLLFCKELVLSVMLSKAIKENITFNEALLDFDFDSANTETPIKIKQFIENSNEDLVIPHIFYTLN